jgi:hypothetical protein
MTQLNPECTKEEITNPDESFTSENDDEEHL